MQILTLSPYVQNSTEIVNTCLFYVEQYVRDRQALRGYLTGSESPASDLDQELAAIKSVLVPPIETHTDQN